MKYFSWGVIFSLALSLTAIAQEKATVSGYVRDAANGEECIGVTVYLPSLLAGTATHAYGFYSLSLPPGTDTLKFSYLGVRNVNRDIGLTGHITHNIAMEADATYIQEVVVEDEPLDANVVDVQMSRNTIDMNQVRKLPALFGEVDIIKNIQMMPGVITAGEGTSSFFVRGG